MARHIERLAECVPGFAAIVDMCAHMNPRKAVGEKCSLPGLFHIAPTAMARIYHPVYVKKRCLRLRLLLSEADMKWL